jgi:hypothetical protein
VGGADAHAELLFGLGHLERVVAVRKGNVACKEIDSRR